MFDCFGPLNDRARAAFSVLEEMMQYAQTQAVRGKLKQGSWAEAIIDAVDRGDVDQAVLPGRCQRSDRTLESAAGQRPRTGEEAGRARTRVTGPG